MKQKILRIVSMLLVTAMLAAAALLTVSCTALSNGQTVTGEGTSVTFTFEVTFADGSVKSQKLTSARATVGEALLEAGLIAGDEGAYGLYVKTVMGERHVYEEDQSYWSFYVDGNYASKGVDQTALEAGKVYAFKAEK